MISEVLPLLIPKTLSSDIMLRHGSILSVAEILFALSEFNVPEIRVYFVISQ
jgi:hypothetical protein